MGFCPRCRAVRIMRISVSQRKAVDSKGNIRKILTKIYHCATCGSFVYSKDIEESESNLDDPGQVFSD